MKNDKQHKEKQAVTFLCDIFREIEPEIDFRVIFSGLKDKGKSTEIMSKVSIAGFYEERRKELGRLEELQDKTGSVFLYGIIQPDFFLILKYNSKTLVLPLADVTVERSGFAGSILHISSDGWKDIASIDIFLLKLFSGDEAIDYFENTLKDLINSGSYTARLGKWISVKVFGRDLKKEAADKLAIEEAIKNPENETLKTMTMGDDIEDIKFISGDPAKKTYNTFKTKQKLNSTTMDFLDMVIESDTAGKEIGTRASISTYIFLTGIKYQNSPNLIIIRHREKSK